MIMVSSAAARLGRRHLVAVVVTVAKGYDLDYIWKTQGQRGAERTNGRYYIDAAQAGEPPGRWWGPGAEALGVTAGQVVERKPYDAVYQQRDPRTGHRLGRPRGQYTKFADHLARLKAAEPHATAERLIELERAAAQTTRQPAVYTDVTVSFSKSISVLHASIRENERRARLAADPQAVAYWAGQMSGGRVASSAIDPVLAKARPLSTSRSRLASQSALARSALTDSVIAGTAAARI